ncbi:hypothetical protein GE09DRAFT_1066318 [Coniochaeta sp. 2T2.1]|nr:hypothetical protein GE09DRAFT_1066318 [Coniochaeta sp. 2T2.1]
MADGGPPPPLPQLPPTGENNANELIRDTSAVAALAFVCLILRFFCKLRYTKGIGVDDGLVAFAFACLVASVTLECLATNYGLGTHIFEITDFSLLPSANKYLFVGEFFGIIGIAIAKTSFCVTLLRLANERWHKLFIWFCIVTVNGFMWPCAITFFVGCTPLAKKWDDSVPGHCIDTLPIVNFAVFAGVWSALTDFLLAAFPWFLVWKLQMRRVERIGICICMSMGLLSGVFALVKSAYLPPSLSDYTYKSTPLLIWSASELSIVILASSIPFLRLFWKEIRAKTSSRSRSKSGATNGYGHGTNGGYKMNAYAKMNSGHRSDAGNHTQ